MKRIAFVLFLVSTILMTAFAQTTQTKPVVHKKVPVKPVVDPQTILSPDLKQTLLAAADPASTMADIRGYIHDGRVQVRTAKDRTVFDGLVKYVQFTDDARAKASDASRDAEAASSLRSIASDDMSKAAENKATASRSNKDFQSAFQSQAASYSDAAVKANKDADDAEKQSQDELAEERQDLQTAAALYVALRADLGLPALP